MICVGEIINTHGIKGEMKINSTFAKKEKVFQVGKYIYIGPKRKKFKISHHRIYRNSNLIKLEGYENINEVLPYKGEFLYINRDDLITDELLIMDLIGYQVIYDNKQIGFVTGYFNNNAQDILIVENGTKKHFIPYVKNWIQQIIDKNIYLEKIEGLIDEN